MPDQLPGQSREERHAFLVARIRIATFLCLIVAVMLAADIVLPDSQFHLDQVTLVTLIAAILVLLGLGRFVGGRGF